MTATAHALVAGTIASQFPDLPTSSLLAFVSHFVMDSIPHWDIGTNWRSRPKPATGILAIGETVLGISLAYFFFSRKVAFFPLTVTVLFSLLPDWLETPWHIFFAHPQKRQPAAHAGRWERLTYAIYKIENIFHSKTAFPLGIATQIGAVLFFLLLLR